MDAEEVGRELTELEYRALVLELAARLWRGLRSGEELPSARARES